MTGERETIEDDVYTVLDLRIGDIVDYAKTRWLVLLAFDERETATILMSGGTQIILGAAGVELRIGKGLWAGRANTARFSVRIRFRAPASMSITRRKVDHEELDLARRSVRCMRRILPDRTDEFHD